MMYDELIEQLRETSIDFGESDHVSVMLIEAADAIGDLIVALTASNEVIAKSKQQHTNADRIRAMTDEELAEWFAGHDAGLVANVLNNDYVEPTKGGWLEWLETGV